ncbi:hypothetical protein P691DRAFT_104854 [Macrolepiota fuliginosa MF-IS2]|uniref:Uncharacterized protein n=1 Tax=Macrolepiota fuliginosa MF-IS2 TaxID=1400762 RepID=A0A9P5XA50_9AGAR|nr:hypothetical protein P691DRAFT_104854 [Macrolepiota fuliginosa MF-IS2]
MDQRHQAFINEAAGIRAAQHAISEVREIIDERETKNLGGASSSYVLQLQVEDLEGILREVTDARLARKLGVEESTTLRNRGSGNTLIDGGGAGSRGGAVEDDQDVDGDPESMDLLRFVVATAGEIINSVAPPAPSPTVKGKEKSPIGARPRPPPTRTTASSGSRASLSTSPKRTSGPILRLSVPRASTSLTRSPNRSRNTNLMRLSPLTDVRTKAATPVRLVTASATVPPGNAYSDKGKGRAIDGSESKVAPELNLVLSGCNEVQGTDGGSTAQPALELGSDNQLRLGLPGPSGEIGLLVSDNSGKTLQNISAEEAEAVHKSM